MEQDRSDGNLLFLTPDGPEWNPHSDVYARNEESFLDWRGDMIEEKDRQRVLFDETDTDAFISSASVGGSEFCNSENLRINEVCSTAEIMKVEATPPPWDTRYVSEDDVTPSLSHINGTLDPLEFCHKLIHKC